MTNASNCGLSLNDMITKLDNFAPKSLAESWDNVGLLVEPVTKKNIKRILLTNDLTEDVMEEAVKVCADLIISYHPPIFVPLKSVTGRTWKVRLESEELNPTYILYVSEYKVTPVHSHQFSGKYLYGACLTFVQVKSDPHFSSEEFRNNSHVCVSMAFCNVIVLILVLFFLFSAFAPLFSSVLHLLHCQLLVIILIIFYFLPPLVSIGCD
jgi:hypothetical protein